MEQLETLRRKLQSARDLHSVVKTMKSLAAVNIREYEKAVESLQDYFRAIRMGLQIAMRNKPGGIRLLEPEEQEKCGAVVFGSEQGMVGQFNDKIAEFTRQKINEMDIQRENLTVMALGEKLIGQLDGLGIEVDEGINVFGSMVDVNEVNQEMLIKIEEWRLKKKVGRIILFYNRTSSGTTYVQTMRKLFPLDKDWLDSLSAKEWPTHMLPSLYMDWKELFSALLQEYFFVALYRASMESLASENASRLSSMQAAEKNIQERMDDLNTKYQHQRQESITAELLDIISGFEVLS
ncbi:MAG TPA: F0F1 ATP synthase subunit gamma [Acidobacteriota bacterium]|nr:F0F1 ATP synthase subunit gamma [Acidobacteriota bacterium]